MTLALIGATSPPYRPVYLEVPTDLLGAEAGRWSGAERRHERIGADAGRRTARVELLEAAERPLIWAGTGALDAGAAGRRAGRAARGARPHDLRRAWDPAPAPSVPGRHAAARRAGRPAVGRGRPRDLDRLGPRRRADPELGAAAAAAAAGDQPRREDAAKNYRVDEVLPLDAGARLRRARRARAVAGRARCAARHALAQVRAEACAGLDPDALRFLDALSFALPEDAVLVVDMCIPGYWAAGFRTVAAPRRLQVPLGWGTLGYAFPAALGAALAGDRPGRLALGRRRLPLRARGARHDGAGAHPADRRHRRRRRLRDAALRPGALGPPDLRRRPPHARLRRPGARASASGPRPSRASTTRSARRSRATSPTPSRACSSRAPRRSWRRRTRRRTGTAAGPLSGRPLAAPLLGQPEVRVGLDLHHVHLRLLQLAA